MTEFDDGDALVGTEVGSKTIGGRGDDSVVFSGDFRRDARREILPGYVAVIGYVEIRVAVAVTVGQGHGHAAARSIQSAVEDLFESPGRIIKEASNAAFDSGYQEIRIAVTVEIGQRHAGRCLARTSHSGRLGDVFEAESSEVAIERVVAV